MVLIRILMKVYSLNSADYIKGIFIDFLLAQNEDIIIGNEIMYGTERRLVDLLLLKKNRITAIEIKSDNDNLKRFPEQIAEYRKIFNYVVVLITEKHFNKILEIDQKDLGVYVIKKDSSIKKIRSPKLQNNREKNEILYSINSKYLRRIGKPQYKKLNADDIRTQFAKRSLDYLQNLYFDYLKERIEPCFTFFLSERGSVTHIEDLNILSSSRNLIE